MIELAEQGDLVGVTRDENGLATTLTCECGHVEPVTDDGSFMFVPTGLYRWHVEPKLSQVSQVHQYRYICPSCFEKLPEE